MELTKPASNTTVFTNNSKVKALETSLHQSIVNFEELLLDLQQLHTDSENYKLQYLSLKEKCKDKTCEGVEELKKIVATKDNIIQAVASTLTKLNETKDFNILSDAFKILFENVATLTPPTEDSSLKTSPSYNSNKVDSPVYENTTPYDENTSITEDVSYKEESLNEIESTPTSRKSPILQIRKAKSVFTKADVTDKKKCPEDWPTPERKAVKLIFPTSRSTPKAGRKSRQTRLQLATVKTSTVVDLTCSPDVLQQKQEAQVVQPLIKKESMEEDTILPSPTSGPANIDLIKTTSKPSPSKFKRPSSLSLKSRCEKINQENKDISNNDTTDMDVSINILNQFVNKLRDNKKENSVHKESPVKRQNCFTPIKKEEGTPVKKETAPVKMDVTDEDATNASISMQDIEALEQLEKDLNHINVLPSPLKRPLAENNNILNTPPKNDPESSMSILRPETKPAAVEAVKRKMQDLVEPVYKEPTVRKKADKKNLQGWSCEECMNFYGVLYKNDPVMLSKKVQECSKHRGRHNPVRPKTPPNFWNPRWTVPDDTEELNRMNNAN